MGRTPRVRQRGDSKILASGEQYFKYNRKSIFILVIKYLKERS